MAGTQRSSLSWNGDPASVPVPPCAHSHLTSAPDPHDSRNHSAFSSLSCHSCHSSCHETEAGQGAGNVGAHEKLYRIRVAYPPGYSQGLSPAPHTSQFLTPLRPRAQAHWFWGADLRRLSAWLPSRDEIRNLVFGADIWGNSLGLKGTGLGSQHRRGPSSLSQRGKKEPGVLSKEARDKGALARQQGKVGVRGSGQRTSQALGILVRQSYQGAQRR